MTAQMMEQLDLLLEVGYAAPPVGRVPVLGQGRVIQTTGGGWRCRYTGDRWGWVFYRAVGNDWETWEPSLPHGVDHIEDRAEAVQVLTDLAAALGDDPQWLARR